MDIRYKVYLDGTLIDTIPDGLDELVLSIVREDGFDNSEQVLRDVAESQLSFTGDGYAYICAKRKANFCDDIRCVIQVVCDSGTYVLFDGLIKQSKVEIHHNGCVAKCNNLKDNSFSGLLRDVINVEVDLFNTKTKGCDPLAIVPMLINTPTTPIYPITDILAFDALQVLKYLIAYFTDNQVTVKSNYLTTNKIALTTGYNMHNTTGALGKTYPRLSFEKVYLELRKKEALYCTIMYESDGTPYLSIEPEVDAFSEDPADLLFTMDEMPEGAVEVIDEKRLFNSINVGSNDVKLKDEDNVVVPQQRYTAWNKETYIGCGGCSGEKDTTLDLVSDFIIDGNLVHEAMLQAAAADYTYNDKVFMLNYYVSGAGLNKLVGNNTSIYNARFNNESVLQRWVGVSNSCIVTSRNARYGFQARHMAEYSEIQGSVSRVCGFNKTTFPTIIYDSMNSLAAASIAGFTTPCAISSYTESFTEFVCAENGNYKFEAKVVNIAQDNAHPEISVIYYLTINVYADNTHASIIDTYTISESVTNAYASTNLTLQTPLIGLTVGNVVQVDFKTTADTGILPVNYNFPSDYHEFSLLEDSTNCQDLEDSTDSFKPFLTECDYQLCLDDYLSAKLNKKGYAMLKGQKVWIKKLTYKDRKLSSLTLIHKKSFCGC